MFDIVAIGGTMTIGEEEVEVLDNATLTEGVEKGEEEKAEEEEKGGEEGGRAGVG